MARKKISYGIIAFSAFFAKSAIFVLMIERKYSYCFIDIILGKYTHQSLHKTWQYLTSAERNILQNCKFIDIWKKLGLPIKNPSKIDYFKRKFERNGENFSSADRACIKAPFSSCEFGFPKGRITKKKGENQLNCAKREFSEETGYTEDDYDILNLPPIIETYISHDGNTYENVYYIAQMKNLTSSFCKGGFDPQEVKDVYWCSLPRAQKVIREYEQHKTQTLIQAVDQYKKTICV